jgi:hypothetical protein
MACCEGKALAVVASGRADDAADVRALSPETIEIDKASPNLESADGCVILVLDNDHAPEAFGEKGPSILWRRRHSRAHDGRRAVEVIKCEHRVPS